jgi:hypothetical protein
VIIMSNLKKIVMLFILGLTSLSSFAQVTNIASMGSTLASTAGEVNDAAGVVILAAIAIFALVWGVRVLKRSLTGDVSGDFPMANGSQMHFPDRHGKFHD